MLKNSVKDISDINEMIASFIDISFVTNGLVGLFILSNSISNKSFIIILLDIINNVFIVDTINILEFNKNLQVLTTSSH